MPPARPPPSRPPAQAPVGAPPSLPAGPRDRAEASAKEAWAGAKKKPVTSALITVGGLVAAGAVIWAVGHYELVGKAREAIGV